MEKSVITSEFKGRKLFEQILNQLGLEGKQTTGQFDSIDYIVNDTAVEIKVRYSDYDTLMMEMTKLKGMINSIKSRELKNGWYVNFIDNKCYIFDVKMICNAIKSGELKIQKNLLPKTTVIGYEKTYKDVIYLPKSMAKVYTL